MKEHIDRLLRDLRHPFTRHVESRGRMGLNDVPHAFTNLFVEHARLDPYTAGHYHLYAFVAALAALGGLAAALSF